ETESGADLDVLPGVSGKGVGAAVRLTSFFEKKEAKKLYGAVRLFGGRSCLGANFLLCRA
ncbi:MAG: hypothetical protein Q4G01_05820, partial [Eubacteriales bacterium]|nr:hypothetical protein [Eubacteriales bacterium]